MWFATPAVCTRPTILGRSRAITVRSSDSGLTMDARFLRYGCGGAVVAQPSAVTLATMEKPSLKVCWNGFMGMTTQKAPAERQNCRPPGLEFLDDPASQCNGSVCQVLCDRLWRINRAIAPRASWSARP